MYKKLFLILLLSFVCSIANAADTRLQDMTAGTPEGTDVLYFVDEPGTTDTPKKVTYSALETAIISAVPVTASSSTTLTNKTIDADNNTVSNIGQAEITDNSIQEVDLKVVDTPSDEECLTYEATGGDFEWQACGTGGSGATTDGGDDTYVTQTTDNFSIGATVSVGTSKVGINGTSDQVQLTVQGHTTQTSNLIVAENSAGTDVFVVDPDGDVTAKSITLTGAGTSSVDVLSITSTMTIPNSSAPTVDATGELALDTTITSYDGLLKYYDGTTEMTIVAMPTADLTTTDNHVVAYSSAKAGWNNEASAGGSGATTSSGGVTYPTTTTDDFAMGGSDSTADVYYSNANTTLSVSSALVITSNASGTNYCNDANAQGCWAMEDTGTESDLTSNGEDLTEVGGTIPVSGTKVFGSFSRDFESTETEYLTHADGGSTDISGVDQSLSVCAWFRRESDSGSFEHIAAKWDSGASQKQYVLYVGGSFDRVTGIVSDDGSTNRAVTGTTSTVINTWYHACFVYNDTDLRLYLDGVSDATPVAYTSGIIDTPTAFTIGASFDSGAFNFPFDGLIDDVIVLDRALSASEVADIYNNGIQGNIGGLDTFIDSDTTPNVSGSSRWDTNTTTVTITDFDGGTIANGQLLYVISKGAITYDCTSSGLKCGTTDLVTASGDITVWMYDGTDWYLLTFTDQSDDLS